MTLVVDERKRSRFETIERKFIGQYDNGFSGSLFDLRRLMIEYFQKYMESTMV